MDFSRFPERIISGFAHLTWVTILVFIVTGKSHTNVIDYFKEISGGAAALFASAVIGLSFFFGNLSDQLITRLIKKYSDHYKIPQMPTSSLDATIKEGKKDQVKDLQNKYTDKAFFRSIFCAGLFLLAFSTWWSYEHGTPNIGLIIIGLILEILVFMAYENLRREYRKLYNSLNSSR